LNATAVLPVKRRAAAKQRLGLEGKRRDALVTAMLEDVLEAIGGARMVERTLVVTGDPVAEEIARGAAAEVVHDPSDPGHPEAALIGIRRAVELGAASVVLLPGDCPLLDARELDSLLSATGERHVAVVPDRHGTGTNGLVLSPPDAIRPAFGVGSRQRHVDAAREAGIPFYVEEIASLALDLDTPADLIALTRELEAGRGSAPRTAKVLGI
jgi:2-phospho-L-lactate/phosphoenolpyruvate guanylyltransferase